MDWYDLSGRYHERTFKHECKLSSLPEEWHRELAALWRLEADVNNGAYLQFFSNWGRDSYTYASQGLKKIGALKMAEIIDNCQALVDEHTSKEMSRDEVQRLMPNRVIDKQGNTIKEQGSDLPESVLSRIYELSYKFMEYPEDISALGVAYYSQFVT
jgi:hypothetical protein